MKKKSIFRFFFCFSVILMIAAVDQILKSFIQSRLSPGKCFFTFGWFSITYVRNSGAAFGILAGYSSILVPAGVSILLLILLLSVSKMRNFIFRLIFPEILICGGAVGNLIDRIRLGYVIDYFYLKNTGFPVFNLADVCITVGCVWLFLNICLKQKSV